MTHKVLNSMESLGCEIAHAVKDKMIDVLKREVEELKQEIHDRDEGIYIMNKTIYELRSRISKLNWDNSTKRGTDDE